MPNYVFIAVAVLYFVAIVSVCLSRPIGGRTGPGLGGKLVLQMIRFVGESVVIRPLRQAELDVVMAGRIGLAKEATPRGALDRDAMRARVKRSGSFDQGKIDLAIETERRIVGEIQTYRPPNRTLPPETYEIGVSIYDETDRHRVLGLRP